MENKNYKENLVTLIELESVGVKVKISGIRIRKQTKEEVVRVHLIKEGELSRGFEFTLEQVKSKAFRAKNFGVPLKAMDIFALMQAVNEKYYQMKVINDTEGLGFQYNNEGGVAGYAGTEVLDENGDEVIKDIEKDLPSSKGNPKAIIKALKSYLNGKVVRQVVILYALAAVICGLLKKNLLLSIVGNSRSGKTTAAKLALSGYCSPDDSNLSKTFAATTNFLIKSLDNVYGSAVLIDDASLSSLKDFTGIVYELMAGIEKGRLLKGNQPCKRARWNTVIMMTTENSILFKCNPDMEGVIARLMEIEVANDDLFEDAEQANLIQHLYTDNHGLLAIQFIKYLFKGGYVHKIDDLYTKELSKMREGVEKDGVMQSILEGISIITLTAKLASEALGIKFDREAVGEFLINISRSNLEEYRSLQTSSSIVEDTYIKLLEYGAKSFPQYVRKGLIFIPGPAFRKFIRGTFDEYKPLEVRRALKRQGFLDVNADKTGHNLHNIKGICIRVNEELIGEEA